MARENSHEPFLFSFALNSNAKDERKMKLKIGIIILCVISFVVQALIVLGQMLDVKFRLEYESLEAVYLAHGFVEKSIILVAINSFVIIFLLVLLFKKDKLKV